jgi:hypothetical protein
VILTSATRLVPAIPATQPTLVDGDGLLVVGYLGPSDRLTALDVFINLKNARGQVVETRPGEIVIADPAYGPVTVRLAPTGVVVDAVAVDESLGPSLGIVPGPDPLSAVKVGLAATAVGMSRPDSPQLLAAHVLFYPPNYNPAPSRGTETG